MDLSALPHTLPAPHPQALVHPPHNFISAAAALTAPVPKNAAVQRVLRVGDRVRCPKRGRASGVVIKVDNDLNPQKVQVKWDSLEFDKNRSMNVKNLRRIDYLESRPGGVSTFPNWANKFNFTPDQQELFCRSQNVDCVFKERSEAADNLLRQHGLYPLQRNELSKIMVDDSMAIPRGKKANSQAYRKVYYRCKCGRNDRTSQPAKRVNATVLWPEVGCPFAVVAKFAVETLPDNTPGKIGDRGDARTDYLYLMSLQGCVEHSPACRAAQPMRRERKTKQVPPERQKWQEAVQTTASLLSQIAQVGATLQILDPRHASTKEAGERLQGTMRRFIEGRAAFTECMQAAQIAMVTRKRKRPAP